MTQERDLSEAILNNMPGLFYLITKKGRFLRWNRQFPPTQDKLHRNDLVEQFQGNRNPYVDDPTLVSMLAESRRVLRPGGRLGLYTPDRAHYVARLKAHDFIS